MAEMIGTDTRRVVLGLGKTGHSIAAWLSAQGKPFHIMDTRDAPPYLEAVKTFCPADSIAVGGWRHDWLAEATELYVSPGIALAEPEIQQALDQGASLISDVDIYCQYTTASVIAVTGSNGKSTVVSLLAEMARAAGLNALAGGNIGTPVLELLDEPHDVAILELSSFQLEMTHSLQADVAMVLNVSPDHMDRYPDMLAYRAAKHRVFNGCRRVVFHADDPLTQPLVSEEMPQQAYALGRRDLGLLSIESDARGIHLFQGVEALHTWPTLKIKGRHNALNVLSAVSVASLMEWDLSAVLAAIEQYPGLPHRCEWVAEIKGVTFINDSKGTNVGATLAALDGLAPECAGRLHLLAGGDGKSADFKSLGEACVRLKIALQTYGQDGDSVAAAAEEQGADVVRHATLEDALSSAWQAASPGDWVLLSPACASFDQYKSFEARGEAFVAAVNGLDADDATREAV